MNKEKKHIEIEITKSMISAILCVAFVMLILYVWQYTRGFSARYYQEDYVEIISLVTFLLSLILVPITFLFSIIKSIKEFFNSKRIPLVFIVLLYSCFTSVLFTFFI